MFSLSYNNKLFRNSQMSYILLSNKSKYKTFSFLQVEYFWSTLNLLQVNFFLYRSYPS